MLQQEAREGSFNTSQNESKLAIKAVQKKSFTKDQEPVDFWSLSLSWEPTLVVASVMKLGKVNAATEKVKIIRITNRCLNYSTTICVDTNRHKFTALFANRRTAHEN